MTNNQLNVILEAAKLGSISAAAKELGLSQPNASSYIKAVEEEAGFKIFERTRDGIAVTPNGAALLEQAQRIYEANKAIQKIKEHSRIRQFRLGSVAFSLAGDAFADLCADYGQNPDIKFSHVSVSMEKGMELLQSRQIDMLVALSFDEDDLLINRICREKHLKKKFIASVPTAVTVRMGHPLLTQADSISIKDRGELLKPYTMIYYTHLDNVDEVGHTYKTYNIPHTGMILIADRDERFRIVSRTDGFAAGICPSDEPKERYGLADIPITDIKFNVFCYIRENEGEMEEIKKYLQYFEEEVRRRFGC